MRFLPIDRISKWRWWDRIAVKLFKLVLVRCDSFWMLSSSLQKSWKHSWEYTFPRARESQICNSSVIRYTQLQLEIIIWFIYLFILYIKFLQPSWRHLPHLSDRHMVVYKGSDINYSWETNGVDGSHPKVCGYIKEGSGKYIFIIKCDFCSSLCTHHRHIFLFFAFLQNWKRTIVMQSQMIVYRMLPMKKSVIEIQVLAQRNEQNARPISMNIHQRKQGVRYCSSPTIDSFKRWAAVIQKLQLIIWYVLTFGYIVNLYHNNRVVCTLFVFTD